MPPPCLLSRTAMSWLARSLANSLRLNDDDATAGDDLRPSAVDSPRDGGASVSDSPTSPTHRGVKEDLSELRETLTRQLWGVATFLAPPPPTTPSRSHPSPSLRDWNRSESSDPSISGRVDDDDGGRGGNGGGESNAAAGISGFQSDMAEIGGTFRSGFSRLSHRSTVSEISKMASNLLPFVAEEGRESVEEFDFRGVFGVTEEVLAFAKNIATHPETWLDFPLEEEQDLDDFDLSDTQKDHAFAVEQILPRLAALRYELCPGHMSNGYFWKVYFVLLHPRLKKQDAELLSTPQLVAARARWMQELQKRTKPEKEWSRQRTAYTNDCSSPPHEYSFCSSPYGTTSEDEVVRKSDFEPVSELTDIEADKYTVSSFEMEIIDKSVIEEKPVLYQNKGAEVGSSSKADIPTCEDGEDDWLQEENSELGPYVGSTIPFKNEEDVSFSDLEDDGDWTVPVKS